MDDIWESALLSSMGLHIRHDRWSKQCIDSRHLMGHWDTGTLADPLLDSLHHPSPLPMDIPFKQSKPMIIGIPMNNKGKTDVYIDDFISVTPDISDNCNRTSAATILAIRSLSRPLDNSDPIPRKDIISLKKFIAEGSLEETKIILGWKINSRALLISLPTEKPTKWKSDIDKLISSTRVTQKQLKVTLGRLNHLASIIPMMRHF